MVDATPRETHEGRVTAESRIQNRSASILSSGSIRLRRVFFKSRRPVRILGACHDVQRSRRLFFPRHADLRGAGSRPNRFFHQSANAAGARRRRKRFSNRCSRELPAPTGRRDFDLTVAYTDNKIWNPATQRFDKVHLRSYTGDGVNPDAPYVAPEIEVRPGQTVSMTLHNKLPADPSCIAQHGDPNDPHCFNGTNLHSHGLWISPTGNSDNMLLSINPGVDFEYIYNLPLDHPAGTFWYHSHRHGSTALQVSSGMAGALIVRGDRQPTLTATGDIDVILKNANLTPMDERILVLQQIQYACLNAPGKVKVRTAPSEPAKIVAWVCDEGDVGVIENTLSKHAVDNQNPPQPIVGFGPSDGTNRRRFTTINGVVRPTFQATGRTAGTLAADPWRYFRHHHLRLPQEEAVRARNHRAHCPGGGSFIEENAPASCCPTSRSRPTA